MTQHEFTRSINLYAGDLQIHALGFTKNLDDANDLIQNTMIKAIRFAAKFEHGTNFKGWLFIIMRNTFINTYRKTKKIRNHFSSVDEISPAHLSHWSNANQAEGSFAMNDIKKALDRLPKIYSVPFIRYFEGYGYKEIADALNIPLGTVKTHIHQARLQLKAHLKQYK